MYLDFRVGSCNLFIVIGSFYLIESESIIKNTFRIRLGNRVWSKERGYRKLGERAGLHSVK